MDQQLVVFHLGQEAFAVHIAAVESIIKLQGLTRLPNAPIFVEGVTNLRGSVLPVIDLRRRMGLPAGEWTPESRIIVISLGSTQAGMIVDSVSEVLTIQSEEVEPAPDLATTINSAFVKGIVKAGLNGSARLVILLDPGKILSQGEAAEVASLA